MAKKLSAAPKPAATPHADEQQNTNSDFFERLQQLTAEDWQNGHKVYCYRSWPIIDKRDEQHFLAKVHEPFDEDYLLRHFGTGKYYLRLNNRRGETIASQTVAVHNPDFPPRVSPDEVVAGDPRNETYFKVWGPKAPAAAQPTTVPSDTAVQELSKLANKLLEKRDDGAPAAAGPEATLTDKLVQWALDQTTKEREQQPAPDGLALIDRLVMIADKLRPPQPAPAPAAPDLLSQVDKLTTVFEKLKPIFAPEAPEAVPQPSAHTKMAGWQEFLQPVLPEVVKSVAPLLEGLGQMMVIRATQNGPQNVPPRVTPGAQPAAGQVPQDRFTRLLLTVVDPALTFIEDGATGADFAAFIYDGWGEGPLMAARKAGVEALIAFYHGQPELWPSIAKVETQFRQLLQDAIAWPIPDEEQTGEPSGPPTEPLQDASDEPVIDLTSETA